MTQYLPDARAAGALLVRALNTTLTVRDDKDYKSLLELYGSHSAFAQMVRDIAEGMELRVVGPSSASSLIVVPASSTSHFALKMGDLRNFDDRERQMFVLVCAVLAKLYFPDDTSLDSEQLTARQPITVATMVKAVLEHANHFREEGAHEAASGWALLAGMREKLPNEQRANKRSISGWVRLALRHLSDAGLVRVYAQANTEEDEAWQATQRFQVQLRECALPSWFRLVREQSRAVAARAATESESAPASASPTPATTPPSPTSVD